MNICKHRYGTSITPEDSSYDVFNIFKNGLSCIFLVSSKNKWVSCLEQYHLGVVVEYDNSSEKDPRARAVGIVTLEDIIEEMIQEEIVDETDVFSMLTVWRMISKMCWFLRVFQLIIVEKWKMLFHNYPISRHLCGKIRTKRRVKSRRKWKSLFFNFSRQVTEDKNWDFVSFDSKKFRLGVEPFKDKYISTEMLKRFLNFDFYKEYEFDEDDAKAGHVTYIFEYGKPVDYFVLIVNGSAELETGREKIVSEIGSFYYFGVTALYVRDLTHTHKEFLCLFVCLTESWRENRRINSFEIE